MRNETQKSREDFHLSLLTQYVNTCTINSDKRAIYTMDSLALSNLQTKPWRFPSYQPIAAVQEEQVLWEPEVLASFQPLLQA